MKQVFVHILFFFIKFVVSLRYKVKVKGLKKIHQSLANKKHGILFLPNHPSYLDATFSLLVLYQKYAPRGLAVETYYFMPVLHKIMKLFHTLPVPDFEVSGSSSLKRKRWDRVFKQVVDGIKSGENFMIFPSGRVKLSGVESLGGSSAVHNVLKEVPQANVVLVRIGGMWGSHFSRALTGKTPFFFEELVRGAKTLLKNFIFFAPRRRVTIDFELASEDFPLHASKMELNQYLEQWYNLPYKSQTTLGEPLNLVSLSCFKKTYPTLEKFESDDTFDLSKVPQKIQKEIIQQVAHVSKQNIDTIHPETHLAKDLGLDSLDAAELILFLDERYDIQAVQAYHLTTVASVIAIASGIKKITAHEDDDHVAFSKHWDKLSSRKVCKIPQGKTLQEVFLRSCDRMGNATWCADPKSGVLTYKDMKLRAIILARYFEKIPGQRLGILLPASAAVYIVIFAALLAKKVPVMINWTVGKKHLSHVLKTSSVESVISSWAFINRLDNVDLEPIDDKLELLEDIVGKISFFHKLAAKFQSFHKTETIMRRFALNEQTKEDCAVLLYTSGTENLPKGVPLSHHNLLSNMRGALTSMLLSPDEVLLAFLPPFHSFGFNVTGLFAPLIGIRCVYNPDPTNSLSLAKAIDRWKVTLVAGAPTFVKGILKSAELEQLSSVRFFVTGAEKAPQELVETIEAFPWKPKFVEGYGITECSPLLSFNPMDGTRKGVGKAITGVDLCIVHPETHNLLPQGKEGMILARGPNVFSGYLDTEIASPFVEIQEKKWYRTGDLGYFDAKGFLFISGRLKRFVKVGGEMVSLSSIEDVLLESASQYGWELAQEGPSLAVCAKEYEGKRPDFFLFTCFSVKVEEVNRALREAGLGNLAKISAIKQIDEIPIMGTGKVHYRSLETLLETI